MLTRLTHAAVAFALMAALYQAYVLLAVPFIEPPQLQVLRQLEGTIDPADHLPAHKHRDLLAAYFPADHWTLAAPPKSFDNGQAMVVLDDYQPQDDGEVRVSKCVVLFFPSERVPGEAPPRDAVILEAPHGAVIQLDEGFTAGLNGIGRLQWAKLLGEIIVRSDMQEAGPQDDLVLKTRDLYMNQDLIRTDAEVDMRLGDHWGKGRVLEIRLVAIERGKVSAGPDIGGIDSLEIVQNVEAHLAVQGTGLFDNAAGSKVDAFGEMPPVHVSSAGRFKFDFTANLASFVEKVKLQQNYSNGARNRLTCDALNLYLAGEEEAVSPVMEDPAKVTSVAGRTRAVSALHTGTIEAHGTELSPVELTSDTHAAAAKCNLMRIELGPQRVTFSGQDEIVLTYQGNEIHAPMVQYQAPPGDSGYRVGTLLAAGNGWLKARPGASPSQQSLELRWTEGMDLRRMENRPVLTVRGRPRLTMAGGRLWADELQLVLRERAGEKNEQDILPADILPECLTASGHVDIQSAELSGKVNRLDIKVHYLPNDLVLGDAAGSASPSGSISLLSGGAAAGRSYDVNGEQLSVEVAVRDGHAAVRSLDVRGDILFREESEAAGTQPLVVRGKKLTVQRADTPSAEISLKGSPASITAQGMSIRAAELQLNRGSSGAMIDSPGDLMVPMNRDLAGNPLVESEPLEVTWQGGMNLQNDRITFQGDVEARHAGGHLNTNRLDIVLSQPIKFDGAASRNDIQLAEIECRDGVAAQFVQRDPVGPTSVSKLYLQSISANQISGEIKGLGPGWIESVHLSTNGGSFTPTPDVVPGANFTAVSASRPQQHLRFLKIEFNKAVEGSLVERNRNISVIGNVRTVYGPVDSWEQKLPTVPNGSLRPDTIYLESHRLQVAQSPLARLNPSSGLGGVELMAEGSGPEKEVIIEGLAGNQGIFTARAHRAKYDQQKSKFVLEGDGVRPARLMRQKHLGAPWDEQSFNRFEYNHGTDEWSATIGGRGQINGMNLDQ